MGEGGLRISHLIVGFSAAALVSCVLLTFFDLLRQSVFMLAIFNLLFAFTVFPLRGSLTRKILLLSLGNVTGALWSYLFSSFAILITYYIGDVFNVIYMILYPFVNLMWIVSFWSVSLTFIAAKEKVGD
jgi:hypothetical protein